MDASFTLTGLIEEFNRLLEDSDFEGAEAVLTATLGGAPERYAAFFHYQFGRLYVRWDKLSSAIAHLDQAAELAHASEDEVFLIQVMDELRLARGRQQNQKP